jgi:hypothetical protein
MYKKMYKGGVAKSGKACGGTVKKMAKGGGVKVRGCGAAIKGTKARGPMG